MLDAIPGWEASHGPAAGAEACPAPRPGGGGARLEEDSRQPSPMRHLAEWGAMRIVETLRAAPNATRAEPSPTSPPRKGRPRSTPWSTSCAYDPSMTSFTNTPFEPLTAGLGRPGRRCGADPARGDSAPLMRARIWTCSTRSTTRRCSSSTGCGVMACPLELEVGGAGC